MPKKGFTLIELLVVVSLIGILATLVMANLTAGRGRSRDAQRKSDLRQISTALRLYYNDNGEFPLEGDIPWGAKWDNGANSVYMNIVPDDPLPDQDYTYVLTDSDNYTLSSCLENQSDDKCDKDPNTSDIITCGTGDKGCLYSVKP